MGNSTQDPSSNLTVWYACYGSNLKRSRFDCYVTGGTPLGAKIVNPGARDRTPPVDSRPVRLGQELYFAGHAQSWGGAPAFIREGRSGEFTYGRMYRITEHQFNDVVAQENGLPVDGTRLLPPLEHLISLTDFVLPGNPLYGRLLHIGDADGSPVLTFTTGRELAIVAPSRPYVQVIASGLKETYGMSDSQICSYLAQAPGIRDSAIRLQDLAEWVRDAE